MSELLSIIQAVGTAPAGSNSPIFLPAVNWPGTSSTGVVPASTLNETATTPEERQATVAAENALIRILYGRGRLGAGILNVLALGTDWVIQAVWCRGENDAIESTTLDDKELPDGVTVTHYLGTATQTVNATMVAAFAALAPPIAYTDTLPHICYSVFRIPETALSGFPSLHAVIRGLKCYDSREDSTNGGSGAQRLADPSTWTWTECPALHEADLIASSAYGAGKELNWASVASTADANDATVGSGPTTEVRRQSSMLLDNEQDVADWVETLRAAAACWVLDNGGVVSLVPDQARAAVATYDWDAGQIVSITRDKKRDPAQMPTVINVRYTDTSTLPWREGRATVYAPGVLEGTTPFRKSDVAMPWITRHSQADREAKERLNKLTLADLSFTMKTVDDGLALEKADVIAVTAAPHGYTAKQMWIDNARAVADGFEFDLIEYDPAVYSDDVVTTPTYPDTQLPRADQPLPGTALVLDEDQYSDQALGITVAKVAASWTPPVYPFIDHYRIDLVDGARVVQTATVRAAAAPFWLSGAVEKGKTYTVNVYTISTVLVASAALTSSITAVGKSTPPGNVPRFTQAFEIGGEVFLRWDAATDTDFLRYEVRHGPTAGSWETATVWDTLDSLYARIKGLPAGARRFYVKAIDTAGNFSTTALYRDITLSLDDGSFLLNTVQFATPTLTNMVSYRMEGTPLPLYLSAVAADDAATQFPAAMNTYGNPIATYRAAGTSSFVTEAYDFGVAVTGNFSSNLDYADIAGVAAPYIEVSPDGSTWTPHAGLSAKTVARYVRVGIDTTGTMLIRGIPALQVDAIARAESSGGTLTSNASGATTITLAGEYSKALRIVVTVAGTTAATYTVDNVVLAIGSANSFDVYIFDSGGTQIARDFRWEFQGV